MQEILKIGITANIMVYMIDSADHRSGKTGLTLVVSLAKNVGSYAVITPTVLERGYGWYQLTLTPANLDTLGYLLFHITSAGADNLDISYKVADTSNDATAQAVWEYNSRTLTYSPSNSMSISNTSLQAVRGDDFTYTFTDIDLTDVAYATFTLKKSYKDEDYQSVIQINSITGLAYLNGKKITTGTTAEITYDALLKTVSLTIDAIVMKQIPYADAGYYYDVQTVTNNNIVETPVIGAFELIRDVTRTNISFA